MKHRYTYFFSSIVLAAALILQSNANGPASNGNRATGAPGDGPNTCTSCHTGGSFGTVSVEFSMVDTAGNEVSEYAPNQVYTISVGVESSTGSPSGYGFQMIDIQNDGGNPIGGFSNPGTDTKLSNSSSRQYAEHSAPSVSGDFLVDWTAPDSGAGSVTFFLGANAVNGNGLNNLDNAVLADFSISELDGDTTDTDTVPDGVLENSIAKNQMSVFPNPATDQIQLKGVKSSKFPISLYSINGDRISIINNDKAPIDISYLKSGVYFFK
ncbi:MAG: choice-of-anchor V domain-containing protein, partial [Salibacteraceae bacterium]